MSLFLFDILLAILIGIFTGIVLQRGRVCSNTAFRNLLIINNKEIAFVFLIAVLIEIIGYQILVFIPNFSFQSNPIPFSILLVPIGGFIFGLGTVFAGGCAGGTCYRIGEGSIKSFLAFIGFAFGIGLSIIDPFNSIITDIRIKSIWINNEGVPSLENFFPREIWTFTAILILLGIFLYIRQTKSQLNHLLPKWSPIMSGTLLGILGTAARASSTLANRNFGFSTTDGIGEVVKFSFGIINLLPLEGLGWAGIFVIGLILGSFISSVELKEFRLKIPNLIEIGRYLGGGFLLGLGAILALGCNFGHILGGIPELGISSIVALIFMILGNWSGSYLIYIRFKQMLPQSTPQISKN
ncbi:YeeE/YedE family protein [Candidatus Hodarchaeum mangrovi]